MSSLRTGTVSVFFSTKELSTFFLYVQKNGFRNLHNYRDATLDPTPTGQEYSYELVDPFFTKMAFYGELEHDLTGYFDILYRFDGITRYGVPLPGSKLQETKAQMLRYTQGINIKPYDTFFLKLNYEYWWLSGIYESADEPSPNLHVVHAALVGNF